MRLALRHILPALLLLTTPVSAAPKEATTPEAGKPKTEPPKKPEPPEKPGTLQERYVSKGVRSRFCFGVGLHIGVNSLRRKEPLLSGVSVHFRMSGIAGISLEYDFNRVAKTPAPDDLSIGSLHFIPNFRLAVVLHPYRWRMLGPYIFGGMGIDTVSSSDRSNFQLGFGLEATFWHDRIALLVEFRAFLPRPTDVQKQRERLQIIGEDVPSTTAYYNVANVLFTLSLRFYY